MDGVAGIWAQGEGKLFFRGGRMCSNDSNVGKPLKKAKGTVAYGMRPEERVLKAAT